MKKPSLFSFLIFGSLLLGALPLQAKEVIPASVSDITGVMGMDANGLELTQEKLPDLFTLTASRLEEDPKTFVVQLPYKAGRWKGGRAVIEYARDLSYTMVSIYDRNQRRQRIFSVSAKSSVSPVDRQRYAAAVSAAESPAAVTEVVSVPYDQPVGGGVPIGRTPFMVDGGATRGGGGYVGSTPVGSGSSRSVPPPPAAKPSKGGAGQAGFVWDETKNMYVPSAKPNPSVPAASESEDYVWDDQTNTYVEAGKAGSVSAPTPVAEKPAKKTKAELRAEREAAKTVEREAKAAERAAKEAERVAKREAEARAKEQERHKKAVPPAKEIEVAQVPATNSSAVWLPPVSQKAVPTPVVPAAMPTPSPSSSSGGAAAAGYVWDDEAATYVPVDSKGKVQAPPPPSPVQEKKKSRKERKAERPSEPTPVVTTPTVNQWVPPPAVASNDALDAAVPSTEELLDMTPTVTQKSAPPPAEEKGGWFSRKKKEEPAQSRPTVAEAMAQIEAEEKAAKTKRDSRAKAEPVRGPEETIPVVDSVPIGPDTSGSDAWVPKEAPRKAVVEPDLPLEAVKVAHLPKPPPPAIDNSIDAILRAAEKARGTGAPTESESWVPKNKGGLSKADQDIAAELERVRKAKKAEPVTPKITINRDINNPEEGVLPVSQFEKFEGPRYGRHREYERRFFYGKRAKAPIQDYDFYVDEVDRKKEIHNIYYYKKGKVPKLVAVQKHEKVTFLSNYDVDKEDKGKVIRY